MVVVDVDKMVVDKIQVVVVDDDKMVVDKNGDKKEVVVGGKKKVVDLKNDPSNPKVNH
eukprot:CAMPEP_0117426252 /NCGR_PEP_ID=MMETSP0758-20121206/6407_1 /TAXON_ID=63605 /ORGANISM="Percolomonas cosmopolitus, Strain AE-1 (ATCC 50343)" /LENGTH=57 /DNA_ID=CAMNT_0005211317 /DNA_START=129 /DNA_END=302 /DNA_ORIENTATION=+